MSGQIILYGPDNQPIKLLGEPQTSAYRPQMDLQQIASFSARRNPILTLLKMEEMLLDPAIKLGLSFLKAPIRKATLIIKSKNPALREWLATNIRRFWRLPLRRVMRGFEYGFSGCEVMYEMAEDAAGDKKIFLKGLKDFAPRDTRPLTYRGQIAGIRVKCPVELSAGSIGGNVDLVGPKALWYAHDMRAGNWFGRSVLMGTQGTYEERNGKDGALDSRFHWYYRHAFRGPSVRYPTQNFVKPGADGELMYLSGRDIAAEIATLGKNGQATIIPSMKDKNGVEMFSVEWPQTSTSSGMDIRDYVKDLRAETWNGLEIPDEIIAAEGTGALAGRRIPERAFYSSREDELNEIIDFLDPQVLKPVAMMNYGRDAQYELLIGEIAPTEQDDGQDGNDGGGNGQQPGGGNPFGNWLQPQGADGQPPDDGDDKPMKFSLPLLRDRVDRWQRHMDDDEKALVLGTELVDPKRPASVSVGVRLSTPTDGFKMPIAGQTMVDPISKLAAERGMALSSELKARLVRLVAKNPNMLPTEFLRSAARIISQYQPRLSALLMDTIVASWIIGAKRGALHLPADVRDDVQNQTSVENAFKHGLARHDINPPIPPSVTTAFYQPGERPSVVFPAIEEAFADLQSRHILDAADFYKLGDQARAASFTVSYVNGTDTLDTIRDKLADAVSTGGTLADFKAGIGEAMDASPLGVAHIETVFRNNIQSATSAGQERVINDPLVIDAFPYAVYEGLADTRQRETHNEMMHQGIPINGRGSNVYRSDDPIWNIWTPPNGHRCRCGKTFITLRQAARLGIQEAKEWLATGTPPANPWHSPTTLQPDPGFASRPAIGGGTAVGLSRPSMRYDLTAHRPMVLDGRAYRAGDAVPLIALDIDSLTCAHYFAPVRLSTMHAPTGGITINGQEYEGGQFIPGDQQGAAKSEAAKTIKHVRDTHDGYSFKTTSRNEQLDTMTRLGYGKEEAAALVSSIGKADRDDAAQMYEDAVHGAPLHKLADAELVETDDSLSADQLSAWFGQDQDHFHEQLTERLKAAGLSSSKAARVAVTAADHVEHGEADKAAAFIADALPKTEPVSVPDGPEMTTRKQWHDQQKLKDGYDVSKSNREYWSMIGDAIEAGKPVNAESAEQYHKMFGDPTPKAPETPARDGAHEPETGDITRGNHTQKLWDAMNKSWDNGETLRVSTMTRHTMFDPKVRDSIRLNGHELQMMQGGKWVSIAGQGEDSLAKQVGMPSRYEIPMTAEEEAASAAASATAIQAGEVAERQAEQWAAFVNQRFGGNFASASVAMEAAGFSDDDAEKFMKSVAAGPAATITDVTPEGYGPTESTDESRSYSPHDFHQTPDEARLRSSIQEGETILKGKLSDEKRGQVQRSVDAAKAKLADMPKASDGRAQSPGETDREVAPRPFKPVAVPGEQMGLFGQDAGGQKKLFDIEKPRRGAKPSESTPSLLEKIGDELDQRADENAPLPGQEDLFGTPREASAPAPKALDPDYEFARKSSVPNVGEDIGDSARHKRNAWRGLEDAEKNGTADTLVTRDNLLRNEPHNLMTHADTHPLTALTMHNALKAFPPKPTTSDPRGRFSAGQRAASAESVRKDYVDAYKTLKAEAERLAETEPDPIKAIAAMRGLVRTTLEGLRGRKTANEFGNQISDPFNATANDLVGMYKSLYVPARGRASVTSVFGKMEAFSRELNTKYPDQREQVEKMSGHAKDIIEGKSLPATFGTSTTKDKTFDPAELYVKIATREGGRDVSKQVSSGPVAAKHLAEDFKLRGLQWGNSVTDDERHHHAAKTVEALTDLADTLGIKPQDVSLDGKLALAIGARGKGRALAHYEPDTQTINLTRAKGVGSLAHEWGHAFDHLLENFSIGRGGARFHSQAYDSQLGMADVHRAFSASGYETRLGDEIRNRVIDGSMSKEKSAYWRSSEEKFARCFERYVQRKLEAAGNKNTYLAGIETKAYKAGGLWPTDAEVDAMTPAFDGLFAAYRKRKYGDEAPVKLSRAVLRRGVKESLENGGRA